MTLWINFDLPYIPQLCDHMVFLCSYRDYEHDVSGELAFSFIFKYSGLDNLPKLPDHLTARAFTGRHLKVCRGHSQDRSR